LIIRDILEGFGLYVIASWKESYISFNGCGIGMTKGAEIIPTRPKRKRRKIQRRM